MFRSIPLVLAVFFCLHAGLLLSTAQGATVLIDFGPTGTAAVANGKGPTTGLAQTWNNYTDTSGLATLSLVDTASSSTGIILSTTGGSFSTLNEPATPTGAPYPLTAAGDAFFTTEPRTITFSGLSAALTYNITVYGYVDRNTSRQTIVTVNGTAQSYEPSEVPSTNLDGGFVTFNGLVPSSSGIINLQLTSGISNNFILSVIELTSVPEPTLGFLLTMGLSTLALRRRRHVG